MDKCSICGSKLEEIEISEFEDTAAFLCRKCNKIFIVLDKESDDYEFEYEYDEDFEENSDGIDIRAYIYVNDELCYVSNEVGQYKDENEILDIIEAQLDGFDLDEHDSVRIIMGQELKPKKIYKFDRR